MMFRYAMVSVALSAALASGALACPEPGGFYTVNRPSDLADDQQQLYLAPNTTSGTTGIVSKTASTVEFHVPVYGYAESFELYYLYVPPGSQATFGFLGSYTTCDDPTMVDPGITDPGVTDPGVIDPGPIDPTPVDPAPVDPAPVDPAPVDPAPVDPAPVDPTPVDPAPVDPTPVDPAPVDPTPVPPPPIPVPPTDPVGPSGPAIGATAPTSLAKAREAFKAAQSGRPLVRAKSNQMAAPSGAPEILLTGSTAQITKARALVADIGGQVLRGRELGGLGVEMITVDLRGLLAVDALEVKLAQNGIKVSTGANSLYRASNARSYANEMVGGQGWEGCILPAGLRIGLIDGPVDLAAPALQNVPILTNNFLGRGDRSGTVNHATELASLIVGQATNKTPAGLARGAQLFAAEAFMRKNGRNVASLEHLAASLDWMVSMRVPLVNMSLAGPQNKTLTDVVSMVAKRGVILVASTGNDGRKVAYPAADPNVIAVTAVDAAGHLFRKANRGPQVDFAAPGVDILVPKKRGKAFRSGTSYSAAIATGIIAHELARGGIARSALVKRLRSHTTDLGPKGKDAQFGYGLLALSRCQN